MVLGNGHFGVMQIHCAACNWAWYRVFYFLDALSRNSWLLSIADTEQSTGVFAHRYNCTFSFMMWHLGWACVYYNVWNNDISSRWDSNDQTAKDVPVWTSCELENDSWEWVGDVLACASTADPISTIPLVIFLSSVSKFVSIWLAGHWILQWQRRIWIITSWQVGHAVFSRKYIFLYCSKVIDVLQ